MWAKKQHSYIVSLKFSMILTPIGIRGVQNGNHLTRHLLRSNGNRNKLSIIEMKLGKIRIGRKQSEVGSRVIDRLWIYQQAMRMEIAIYPYQKLSSVAPIWQTFKIFTIFFQDKASFIDCKALVSIHNRFNPLYAGALTFFIIGFIGSIEDIGIQNHSRNFASIFHC